MQLYVQHTMHALLHDTAQCTGHTCGRLVVHVLTLRRLLAETTTTTSPLHTDWRSTKTMADSCQCRSKLLTRSKSHCMVHAHHSKKANTHKHSANQELCHADAREVQRMYSPQP